MAFIFDDAYQWHKIWGELLARWVKIRYKMGHVFVYYEMIFCS